MPLQATSGAASYDAFGGGVAVVPNYIEECFSTTLYTGNGSTQTITNGIDLAGKGGLVWLKGRSATSNHSLYDTARGINRRLRSNDTSAENTSTQQLTSFNSNGFDLGVNEFNNSSGLTAASWTFREQPKFFDVVTYTGNGANGRAISHNLGSTPGFIVVKRTNNTGNWYTWHRAHNGGNNRGALNSAGNFDPAAPIWGDGTNYIAPTSTTFTVSDYFEVNGNGDSFVAYLFAHNAGGFGLTGTDNVISCGSFTTTSGINSINLGYEPQWVLIKQTNAAQSWWLMDTMRGFSVTSYSRLFPDQSSAESVASGPYITPTATGFTFDASIFGTGNTYIYIAIRRGPMRTPTTGTSVFTPYQVPASPTTGAITGFVTDAGFIGQRAGADKFLWGARLMGNPTINSTSTAAESANTNQIWDRMNGWWNTAINNYMTWGFARAPGFMDVCCYTGTGSARTVAHNLSVAPELMIVKDRSTVRSWFVYAAPQGNQAFGVLNDTASFTTGNPIWNSTTPTSTVFSLGASGGVNASGANYVAYLFASCPGVSKVFNFTGNGSSQTINCGFTGGARFVMIKRTDSTGDWYVWDTARGIVANNDPHLSLNTTAAEVTTNDTIDTDSTGFVVNQVAATNVNVNGASYIGLAIA